MNSKMRSFLTMLGIIIGVGAVIILVSLINGFSADIASSFEDMGTNLIQVNLFGRTSNVSLDPDDVMDFTLENEALFSGSSPTVTVNNATVKYNTTSDEIGVTGVNEYYTDIKNYELSSGRNIKYIDVERRQQVMVIGSYYVEELFGGANPVGEEVRINGNRYQVVGVLEEKDGSTENSDDDIMLIPYTSAARLSKTSRITSYLFSGADSENSDEAMSVLEEFLLSIVTSSDQYRVFNQAEMLDSVNELSATLTIVMVGVAGISLLVGGIGIMNIMLVSVTERTKEIGIRKSLGGKRWDIMSQFVIEAATTSALGGVIGIIFGVVGSLVAANVFGMTIVISMTSVMVAFGVSVAIGMVFGYFPAAKASKLNPIDALRYE